MSESADQEIRLNTLVEAFRDDSQRYKDIEIPEDAEGKRVLLRSLMNIRMPRRMPEKILRVQDEYLQARAEEKGVVSVDEIPVTEGLISVWQGDITRLAADAIVNAANSQMLGCFVPMHTCIDNCIHTYAGIQLRAECYAKMRELRMKYGDDYEQPTAVPMLTGGYNLPAKHVIHVVGPIVQGRLTGEHEKLLAECYRNCLEMAEENHLESIAFCCISTGVFMFPNRRAAEIAVRTVTDWLEETGSQIKVIFNVFKDDDLTLYKYCLGEQEAE